MKYRKTIIFLMIAIFLFSIATVSANDVNDTVMSSEDTSQAGLSASNEMNGDNLQISEENTALTQTKNDENEGMGIDSEVVGANIGSYSGLSDEIGSGGIIELEHDYYTYDSGSTITITVDNSVIDGKGAVIDMADSTNMQVFYVSASGVIIKNLTIKNAKYDSDGVAIYFRGSGTVTNCNFTNNKATVDYSYGGAIYFSGSGTVTNCNFINNSAKYNGGAVYFFDNGDVTNCNFINNSVSLNGGAVYFNDNGDVTNCNFINNSASFYGGAIRFSSEGTVTNCNFTNNKATDDYSYGGAVYFNDNGEVTNCNFVNNTAYKDGGAIYFTSVTTHEVTNCNFVNNTVSREGGAIWMYSGSVENCNFTNNFATEVGGAIIFRSEGTVTNCNFTNNSATFDGGAVYFYDNGDVTNCNFADNSASRGGAILSLQWWTVTADTCIFKTDSDTTFNTHNLPPTLNVDNFSTFYGSSEKVTFDLRTNLTSIPVTNGNISISVYFKNNNSWVCNYSCLSGEGWVPDLPAGSYYAIFGTEYAEFQKINRTITIIKLNSTITLSDIVMDYGDSMDITVGTEGTEGITAMIDGNTVSVTDYNITISGLSAGNHTLAVTTIPDEIHNEVTKTVNITVNKVDSTLSIDDVVMDYGEIKEVVVTAGGVIGITADISEGSASVDGLTITISGLNAGSHILAVTTIPDENHTEVTKTVNIAVNKVDSTLSIDDVVMDYGEIKEIVVTAVGVLSITAEISEGSVSVDELTITISDLNIGDYTLSVTAIPDENHNEVTKTVKITVNKPNSTLTVDDIVFVYGASGLGVVSFTGATGVNAVVVNQTNAVVNVSGTNITVSGLDVGTYTLTVTTIPDDYHNPVTVNATVTVNKISTQITGNAITATYNVNKDLVITLKDANGKALSGVKVNVNLNGAKTYVTDNNGQIKVSTKGLAPKAYTAKVTFNGNINYAKSAKDIKVTVKKATPKLTAKKKTFKTTKKTKKYTIVLKDNTGKAIKKAKVTLKVKGKTYKATTNSKGKATFKIKNLKKKGTFKATITYKGNKYYKKVAKKAKIKVIVTFKTVSKGSKDKSTVKEIQQALKDHGYYLSYKGHYLKVDGKFSSCTFRSVKEFQKDKGLKVTGKVDEKTAHKLGIV